MSYNSSQLITFRGEHTMIVDIDEEVYKQVSAYVEKNKIDYPSIKHYVNLAVRNQLRIHTQKDAHDKIKNEM